MSKIPYYDIIAKRWHEATGYKGGAFKELVLNNILLESVSDIDNYSILELGAGNGYFLPLMLRRFSGRLPKEIIVTDQSERLLEIAKRHFKIPIATYQRLDVSNPFPFIDNHFELIIASMIFNELPSHSLKNAVNECYRVLSADGLLLIAVIHPDFITSLQKKELLKSTSQGVLTMPGTGDLRLPVVVRSIESYRSTLQKGGFMYEELEVYPTQHVLNLKAGLRNIGKLPLALIYGCRKASNK